MRGRFVRSSPGVLMGQSYETRTVQWWFHRVLLAVLATSVFVVFLVLRCQVEWKTVERAPMGSFSGVATLVADPVLVNTASRSSAVRAVVQLEGWRYQATLYGGSARRVAQHLAGESVYLSGERGEVSATQKHRRATQHIVGQLVNVKVASTWSDGSAFTRATNRIRRLLATGASRLPANEAALFLGLVIGDDRNQPREMISAFRDSGLSHLTAVSGQNIAFVLAAAAPLLTRMRPRARLVATLFVLAWFTVLTRAEPSVLRAAAMAAISVLCFTAGWQVKSLAVLALCVAGLVVFDPMLMWQVGFWMSSGATAGLIVLMKPLQRFFQSCHVPGLIAQPLATTTAAQIGTALPMYMAFGRVSPIGLVTNLFAVPIAGVVMLVGLPVCLVAGMMSAGLGDMVMLPMRFGVRWVWWVAVIGQRCAKLMA
ncbi:MAG: putative competence protein ComEC [Actinomycetota bacterium]